LTDRLGRSGVDPERFLIWPNVPLVRFIAAKDLRVIPVVIARDDEPEAVLLYFVDPVRVGRDFCPAVGMQGA